MDQIQVPLANTVSAHRGLVSWAHTLSFEPDAFCTERMFFQHLAIHRLRWVEPMPLKSEISQISCRRYQIEKSRRRYISTGRVWGEAKRPIMQIDNIYEQKRYVSRSVE